MIEQATSGPAQRQHHAPAKRSRCRLAYVRGEVGSLREAAEREEIPFRTVRCWAQLENWSNLRQQWQAQNADVPQPAPGWSNGQAADEPNGQYVPTRLVRVREQLGRLDAMLLTESDPQKLDRLASAQAKLAEQERILDGRPLPGSRRPGKERPAPPAMVRPLD